MQEFLISRENEADLIFTGELMAMASSKSAPSKTKERRRGNVRWTDLELYKTSGGAFVCVNSKRSTYAGEFDLVKAEVATNEQEIIEFFGQGWLSKELYEAAGIKNSIRIS